MKQSEAEKLSNEVTKLLQKYNQWVTVSQVYNDRGLSFLKIEASIKVKQ